METFWFFWLRFRRAYDSAYDSDFWFSPGHKRSYDSAYDSDFWFSLSHKRSYDSAYDSDSDSAVSENQSSVILLQIVMVSPGNDLVKNHESLSVTNES